MNILQLVPEIVFVVVVALAAAAIHWLLQTRFNLKALSKHNEVTGFLFSVIGIIYAVVLGFVVIIVWQKYDAAVDNTMVEASAVSDLYRAVDAYPPALRTNVRRMVHEYLDTVKDVEWPAMAAGKKPTASVGILEKIAYAVDSYDPKTPGEQDADQAAMMQVQRLLDARRVRLRENEGSVPPILWFALITGGLATIGFAFMFGVEDRGIQLTMTGALAAVVAILFVVIYEFNYPFGGMVSISPADWVALHDRLSLIR